MMYDPVRAYQDYADKVAALESAAAAWAVIGCPTSSFHAATLKQRVLALKSRKRGEIGQNARQQIQFWRNRGLPVRFILTLAPEQGMIP